MGEKKEEDKPEGGALWKQWWFWVAVVVVVIWLGLGTACMLNNGGFGQQKPNVCGVYKSTRADGEKYVVQQQTKSRQAQLEDNFTPVGPLSAAERDFILKNYCQADMI